MKGTYPEIEERMKKTVAALEAEFATIRAGRANPTVLDKIRVDYYGASMPINQIAAVSAPEPRMLLIVPYDASQVKAIEKAIQASDLGINPQNDGKTIRLVIPPLTEDRRKEIAKTLHKYAEEAKVSIRNIRRDAIEDFKKQQKASEMTEDDYKICEKDVQELTDKYSDIITKILEAKEKEILEV
ncbi:MAG: ribosome recycling factor [Clostridia bacterium]|nr:ribosome recycling factor [Clostridia bacterium]